MREQQEGEREEARREREMREREEKRKYGYSDTGGESQGDADELYREDRGRKEERKDAVDDDDAARAETSNATSRECSMT